MSTPSGRAAYEVEGASRLGYARDRAAVLALARAEPSMFMRLVLKDERTGRRIHQAPVHDAWQKLLSEHDRILMWSHVEGGKTVQVSIGRTLYELGRDPNQRVAIVSKTSRGAAKILRAIAQYIDRDEDCRATFPELRPHSDKQLPWNTQALVVERSIISKDPSVQCCGLFGDILGSRLDRVIFDDILDYDNTRTVSARAATIAWIRQTVWGRLTEGAHVTFVGNAWHPKDAMHVFAEDPRFRGYRFPVVDAEGRYSWPENWTPERIELARLDMGPDFPRQMLCMPRDDASSRFKREWIDRALAVGEGYRLVDRVGYLPPGFAVYTGVDLAVQQGAHNDLTVLFTILLHPGGARQVLCIESGRWAGPEIVERIEDTCARFGSICIIENNACFVPGTPVLTKARGYVPIECVELGDEVWTHKARWRAVTARLDGTSRTLSTVRARGALPVRATPNHWFYMREAGRTPGRGGGHFRPVGDAQWVSCGFPNKPAYAALARPRWPACAPVLSLRELTASHKKSARTVAVTERLALVLGLYMAEGHRSRGQVLWTLAAGEGYLADFIEQELEELTPGSPIHRRAGAGTLRLIVSSTQLADALCPVGKSRAKCLPVAWLGWPLDTRLALVRGWLLGDGCLQVNNGSTKWPRLFFAGMTISRNWAMFVRATLDEAGIGTALRCESKKKPSSIAGRVLKTGPIFAVALTAEGTSLLRERMTSAPEATRFPRLFAPTARRSNGAMVLDGDHAWSRLPPPGDYLAEAYDGPVHNLVVAEDESFTAEDYIVHNAQDFILQFARAQSRATVVPFTTGRQKAHPEFGVEGLAAEMAAGRWIVPNRKGRVSAEVDAWIAEMLYFSPGEHTGDRLMASWFAREGARAHERRAAPPEGGVRARTLGDDGGGTTRGLGGGDGDEGDEGEEPSPRAAE